MNEGHNINQQPDASIIITVPMLRIHQRYQGDNYFGWERGFATPDEYATLSETAWGVIDELLQRLYFQKAGMAAAEFNADTERMLAQRAATPEVAALLRKAAV